MATEILENPEDVEVQLFVRKGDPESIILMNLSEIPSMQYESVLIEFENIGRGLATNVGILRFDNEKEIRFNPKENFFDSSSSFLPIGVTKKLVLLLPMEKEVHSRKDLVISYTDILGNLYEQIIQLDFIQKNTKYIAGKEYPTYLIYTRMIDSPKVIKTYSLD